MVLVMPVGPAKFKQRLDDLAAQVDDPVAGLFGPASLMWEVNRRTAPYFIATTQAAFMDVAHPWIATGALEHSKIKTDPRARARQTYSMLTTVIFGDLESALRASRIVYARHRRVEGAVQSDGGAFADGSRYLANEVSALLWVHITSWYTRVGLYERVVRPLSEAERDQFWEEARRYAACFGIPDEALPANWAAMLRYVDDAIAEGQVAASAPARELMAFLGEQIPRAGRADLLAFNSLCLPPRVSRVLGLPGDDADTQRRYGRIRRALRAGDAITPAPLRDLPPYREAMARVEGRATGPVTRRLGDLMGGPRHGA